MGVKKTMDTFFASLTEQTLQGYGSRIFSTPMGPFRWDDNYQVWVNINNGMVLNNLSFQDMYAMMDYGTIGSGDGPVGDGSFINWDFTLNVLPSSYLTFSRSGNATYVNSNGYVVFAPANMLRNSSLVETSGSDTTPISWSTSVTGGGITMTIPSSGSRTFEITTGTTGWSYMTDSSGTGLTGLNYTFATEITNISGSPSAGSVIAITSSPTNVVYYLNGATIASSATISSTGLLAASFTSSVGSFARVGLGADGVAVSGAKSITIKEPRLVQGTVSSPTYYASSSTTSAYQGPRFDYNPTTLTHKGLLIEAPSTNSLINTESFSISNWGGTNIAGITFDNSVTNPQGITPSAVIYGITTGSNYHHRNSNFTNGITGNVVASCWMKSNGYERGYISEANNGKFAALFGLTGNGTAEVKSSFAGPSAYITPYPNGWYRCEVVGVVDGNSTVSCSFAGVPSIGVITFDNYGAQYAGVCGSTQGIYIWGPQAEAPFISGGITFNTAARATSYIPSGNTYSTRNNESLTVTTTNFANIWPNTLNVFSVYWEGDVIRVPPSTTQFPWLIRDSSGSSLQRVVFNTTNTIAYFPGGSYSSMLSGLTLSSNTPVKFASASQQGSNAFVATVGNTVGSVVTSGETYPFYGASAAQFNFNPNSDQYMHIKKFKVWPTLLDNSTLQGLVR